MNCRQSLSSNRIPGRSMGATADAFKGDTNWPHEVQLGVDVCGFNGMVVASVYDSVHPLNKVAQCSAHAELGVCSEPGVDANNTHSAEMYSELRFAGKFTIEKAAWFRCWVSMILLHRHLVGLFVRLGHRIR